MLIRKWPEDTSNNKHSYTACTISGNILSTLHASTPLPLPQLSETVLLSPFYRLKNLSTDLKN